MIKEVEYECTRCGKEEKKWVNTDHPASSACCKRLMTPKEDKMVRQADFHCDNAKCKARGIDQNHFYATGTEESLRCCACEETITINPFQLSAERVDHTVNGEFQ